MWDAGGAPDMAKSEVIRKSTVNQPSCCLSPFGQKILEAHLVYNVMAGNGRLHVIGMGSSKRRTEIERALAFETSRFFGLLLATPVKGSLSHGNYGSGTGWS